VVMTPIMPTSDPHTGGSPLLQDSPAELRSIDPRPPRPRLDVRREGLAGPPG
jgi:hypothetical protein